MSIKLKIIIYFSLIFLTVVAISSYTVFISNKIGQYLESSLPNYIIEVQKSSRLNALAELIRYDDEVLTQSARNYAFTGDKSWQERYYEFVPKLDAQIKSALKLGDAEDKAIFESINQSNLALIALETESMNYASAGELAQAQKILDSQEYHGQKDIYLAGLEKFLARRGVDFDSVLAVSTSRLEENKLGLTRLIDQQSFFALGFGALFVFVLLFLFYFIFQTFMFPLGVF